MVDELTAHPQKPAPDPPKRSKRWAELLARVFGFDLKTCPECGGPLKIIAAILEPHAPATLRVQGQSLRSPQASSRDAIRSILTCLRLPDKPPELAPARIPEQILLS